MSRLRLRGYTDVPSYEPGQRVKVHVSADDLLIERTYRTFTGGRPIFLVSEYFPAEYRPNANDGA